MPAKPLQPGHPLRRTGSPPADVPPGSLLPLWRRIHQEMLIRSHRWGLPSNVTLVLTHLHSNPDDTEPAAIAAATYFPRQTITFILDFLERRGFAARKPHPSDRRRKRVQLTLRGQKKLRAIIQDMIAFESAALATIENSDLPRLEAFLTRYADALVSQNDRDLKA